jgi:rubrerythrin
VKRTHDAKRTNEQSTQIAELLYQALEVELGGVDVYRTALQCVQNAALRNEWQKYLEQTETHVVVLQEACSSLDLDPDRETPGRQIVRHIGKSLVKAMQMALGSGSPEAAELVAAECVVLAETKDHLNWELIGQLAKHLSGAAAKVLAKAHDEIEDQEDEHLYHTAGWTRELWIRSLGMQAVIPPPEEQQDVRSAIAAARAKQSREQEASRG